jgi:glycosyltransferase involved in cell wall biosynthesis
MKARTITAVVTVYNGERYISDSLIALLSQTQPPDEVVVVDDGSTDQTPLILSEFGTDLRVIRQENRGHAAALNRGCAAARCEYIAKCDADDLWAARKLEWQREALGAHPQIDVAFGGAEFFGLTHGPRAPYPGAGLLDRGELAKRLYRANSICASTTLVRRALFQRLGPFDERIAAEDYDYWLRALAAEARFFHDPRVLVRFRTHEHSITATKLPMHRAELAVHQRHAHVVNNPWLVRRTLARDLRNIGRELSDEGKTREARAAFVSSLRSVPTARGIVWAAVMSAPDRYRRPLAGGMVSIKRAVNPAR